MSLPPLFRGRPLLLELERLLARRWVQTFLFLAALISFWLCGTRVAHALWV